MAKRNNPDVQAFAARIAGMGFAVYIAESGSYGFITDDTESRVLSFSFNDQTSLRGNYGPPSTTSGTGWRMDAQPSDLTTPERVKEALYAYPPDWCVRRGVGWRYLSTVKQYLQLYGLSSKFERFDAPNHTNAA